jgi:hypothetical protein
MLLSPDSLFKRHDGFGFEASCKSDINCEKLEFTTIVIILAFLLKIRTALVSSTKSTQAAWYKVEVKQNMYAHITPIEIERQLQQQLTTLLRKKRPSQ